MQLVFLRIFQLFLIHSLARFCASSRRDGANCATADLIGIGSNYSVKISVVRVMNVTVKASPDGESFSLISHHLHNYPATRERCGEASAVIRLAFFF